jgi:hypothetical protein
MDLPSISNAPRELPLGGVTYRARALTLGQLGELLAWLEERGCAAEEDQALSPAEVQAMWEQAQAEATEGPGGAPPGVPTAVLGDSGARVPLNGDTL